MPIGVVGRKCGMTRVFTEDGATVPVTVIEALPNRVTQVKNLEQDGYRALQVTSGSRKASRLTKAEAGHFAKAGTEAGLGPWDCGCPRARARISRWGRRSRSRSSRPGRWWTSPGFPAARVTRARSSAITSPARTRPMATRCPRGHRVPSDSARRRARVSGQAHGRAPRQRAADGREPGGRARGRSAPPAPDQGRDSGRAGRRCHRAAGGKGMRTR